MPAPERAQAAGPHFIVPSFSSRERLILHSPIPAAGRAPPSLTRARLLRVTLLAATTLLPEPRDGAAPVVNSEHLVLAAPLDALETAVLGTVEGEAAWLEAQLSQLRRALLVLSPTADGAGPDPRIGQFDRTLQQLAAAFRDRLATLDAVAAALRPD